MRALSSSLYKYTTFSAEIQIVLKFEYKSEMLKCSDLHELGAAMYYITRRSERWYSYARRGGGADGWIPIDFVRDSRLILEPIIKKLPTLAIKSERMCNFAFSTMSLLCPYGFASS